MSGVLNRFRRGSAVLAPPTDRVEEELPAEVAAQPSLEQTSEKTYWGRRIPIIACGSGLFADGYLNSVRRPRRIPAATPVKTD